MVCVSIIIILLSLAGIWTHNLAGTSLMRYQLICPEWMSHPFQLGLSERFKGEETQDKGRSWYKKCYKCQLFETAKHYINQKDLHLLFTSNTQGTYFYSTKDSKKSRGELNDRTRFLTKQKCLLSQLLYISTSEWKFILFPTPSRN